MYMPTRDEIRAAHQQGEEDIIQLFDYLAWELQTMQDQLHARLETSQCALRSTTLPARFTGCRIPKTGHLLHVMNVRAASMRITWQPRMRKYRFTSSLQERTRGWVYGWSGNEYPDRVGVTLTGAQEGWCAASGNLVAGEGRY